MYEADFENDKKDIYRISVYYGHLTKFLNAFFNSDPVIVDEETNEIYEKLWFEIQNLMILNDTFKDCYKEVNKFRPLPLDLKHRDIKGLKMEWKHNGSSICNTSTESINELVENFEIVQHRLENHEYEFLARVEDFQSKFETNEQIKDSDRNKGVNINLKDNEIKVFISYSMEDRHVGAKIKEMLASFGIKCFMAHDDIGVSEEWKQRILRELNEADVFIPILSDNFKNSEFCSQEAGVACFRDILIIPLSLDSVKPYGFMNHRQGKLINKRKIPLKYLLNPIADNFPEADIFGNLIDELKFATNFRNAESLMSNLKPYFDKLNVNEANRVVEVSIANSQIWNAGRCRREYLPKFIGINRDKIDENKLERLLRLIEFD